MQSTYNGVQHNMRVEISVGVSFGCSIDFGQKVYNVETKALDEDSSKLT